ncbi:hypothetical protein VCUG_00818 [Vavraia culicis subsp. floridensis]|uniref:Uncharacterized protein n=1 Tax=Vavraia culicis (isolate floridensis) TaxID=948595 RepID=L2GVN2_VAVCU|nr:uncharacterized protein VCUG_00818 [Vavraia culicis subsp. floridensis]ELA47736.1 hypothetical protein VCUG_00818 [Vavraia culicis subsp. floridensis]
MRTDHLQRLENALRTSDQSLPVTENGAKVNQSRKLNVFSKLFDVRDKNIKYRIDPTICGRTGNGVVHVEFIVYRKKKEIGIFQINNTHTLGNMVLSLLNRLGVRCNVNTLSIYVDNFLYVNDVNSYTETTNYQLRNWNGHKMEDLILFNSLSLNSRLEILYELRIRNIIGRNRECKDFIMKIFEKGHQCVICTKNVAKFVLTDEPLLVKTKKYVCKTCFDLFYCDELDLIYPHLKYSKLK